MTCLALYFQLYEVKEQSCENNIFYQSIFSFKFVFILVIHTTLFVFECILQMWWLSMVKSITTELAEISWIIQ